MKKFYMNFAVLMTCLVSLFTFTSCDKDDNGDSSGGSSIIGTWQSTMRYYYDGEEYIVEFLLKFYPDKTGYWSVTSYDDYGGKEKEEKDTLKWYITSSDVLKIDMGEGEYGHKPYFRCIC